MIRATHNRGFVACALFALYVALTIAEDATSTNQMSTPATPTFDEIGGFVLQSHATVQKGRSRRGCELICARAPTCKSYSYRASDKTCVVSQDALTYDPEFTFSAKSNPGEKHPYHTFEGLTYKSDGWLKSEGKTRDECTNMCSKAPTCKAFSYRDRDRTCLLSSTGIEYDAEFSYYEKNKIDMRATPKVEQAGGGGAAAETEKKPVPPTEDPRLLSLENKEKTVAKTAQKKEAEAQKMSSQAKATVAKMKLETKADVEKAHKDSQAKLAKMEKEFEEHSKEVLSKEKNREKISFAHQELQSKVRERSARLERERERGQKTVSKIAESGREKVQRAQKEAQTAASIEVRKLTLAAKLKETQNEINTAAVKEAKAKKMDQQEAAQANAIKEKEGKEDSSVTKELNQKQAVANADMEVTEKTNSAEAQAETVKIQEASNKKVKEMQKKDMIRSSERGVKESEKANAMETAAKKSVEDANEARQKDEMEDDARRLKVKQIQGETAEALRQRDLALERGRVTTDKMKTQTQKDVYDAQVRQKSAEISSKETNAEKMRVLKTTAAARLRMVIERAHRDTMNVKKQNVKFAMDKTEPQRNMTQIEIDKAKKAQDDTRERWRRDRGTLIGERANVTGTLEAELEATQKASQDEIQHAKNLAKEIVAKAKTQKQLTVAKGDAHGRIRVAKGRENSEKIPGKRVELEKSVRGIINIDIKSDVAAFVDSGDGKQGIEAPALHEAMITAKLKKVQAETMSEEENREYDAAELKYKADVSRANSTLVLGQQENNEHFERIQNQANAAITAANASLGAMPDAASLQSQMEALTSGAYGSMINIPGVTGTNSPPTPPATPSTPSSGGSALTLVELDESHHQLHDDTIDLDVTLLEEEEGADCTVTYHYDGCGTSYDRDMTKTFTVTGNVVSQELVYSNNGGTCTSGGFDHPGHTAKKAELKVTDTNGQEATHMLVDNSGSPAFVSNVRWSSGCGYTPTAAPTATPPPTTAAPSAAPTLAPTESPTVNQTAAIMAAQASANELQQKTVEMDRLQGERDRAAASITSAENQHKQRQQFLLNQYNSTVDQLNSSLARALEEKDNAFTVFTNASNEYDTAKGAYDSVQNYPANTPYGDLQSHASSQGFVRVQTSTDREQMAFMKFGTTQLKDDDTITAAKLKIYKDGGMGGPVRVDVASCQWSRGTLTYTKTLSMGTQRASLGVTASIPEDNQVWVTIDLKGDVVQNSRLAGDHICLLVKGGPSDAPAIFSSELTDNGPKLDLDVKEAGPELNYAQGPVALPAPKTGPPKDERQLCMDRIKQELTEKFTREALDEASKKAQQGALELQEASTANTNGNDVLGVMQMQTESTQLAGDMIQAQTAAIETAAQTSVSQKLENMAQNGATADAIAVASATLGAQATADVAAAANSAAQNIQAKTQQGLSRAEQNLQAQNELDQKNVDAQKEELKKAATKLTASQEAKVNAKVATELATKTQECNAALAPAPASRDEIEELISLDSQE